MWSQWEIIRDSNRREGLAFVQGYSCAAGDLYFFEMEGTTYLGFLVSLLRLILHLDNLLGTGLRKPPLMTFDCEESYRMIYRRIDHCAISHLKCPKPKDSRLLIRKQIR
jgi:hypothetical protein